MRPNVLLIVLDTARADAFEPYGGGAGASPVVGDLARRGSALPRAYSPSNWTLPSHVSMLTGLLPREAGLAQAPGGKAGNCKPYVEALEPRLMPSVLRRAGYETRAVSANAWISKTTGFATGFDEFRDVRSARSQPPPPRPRWKAARWLLDGARARTDDGAAAAEIVLNTWIEQPRERPFFWLVNLVECHSPYLPPRPYNDIKGRARFEAAEDVRRYQTLQAVWRTCAGGQPIASDALARMRHLYGRSIRALDDWLGRLLERLDAKRVLDDTMVIVTSDHGENLGESNMIGHAFSLSEILIHVPLIVSGPGAFSSDEVCSLASLPRRIAAAIDLPEHPWGAGGDEDIVVSQYDALTTPDDPRVARAARDWGLDDEGIAVLTSRGTAATDGRWKLVRERGKERLYDVRADPLETTPMSSNANAEKLRRALEEADRQTPIIAPTATSTTAEENAELEERLKLLGYL